jgi:hypothetical protein
MSKRKLTILVLGALLIGNVNLQAAETAGTEQVQVTDTAEVAQQATPDTAVPFGSEDLTANETSEAGESVSQADLSGVRAEIATLRDQLTQRLDKNIANSKRSLSISGSTQTRYTVSTNPYKSGFLFNSAILSLKGYLRRDYEQGKSFSYTLGLGSNSSYNIQPTDAFLQYSIGQSLDIGQPYLYVNIGQQKKNFGLEATTTEDKQPAINTAQFASKLNLSQRDIGIRLYGDLFPVVDLGYNYRIPLLEYSLAVYNGSGPNTADTNRSKDIEGRIVLNAPAGYYSPWRGLALGGSVYKGKQDLYKGTTFITDGAGQADKIRYGADLSYVSAPLGFTAEYVVGKDEKALSGTTLANAAKSTTESRGYTVTFFYEWGEQFYKNSRSQSRNDDWWPTTFQPFVRYDHWDPNTAVAKNESNITTLGFNFFFAETTKFQLNYSISDDKAVNLKQNTFAAQFQFGF